MTDESASSGKYRYQHPQIHLCDGCSGELERGDQVVCESHGYVDEDESYAVSNRRFWHVECWRERLYHDTGSDRDGGRQ